MNEMRKLMETLDRVGNEDEKVVNEDVGTKFNLGTTVYCVMDPEGKRFLYFDANAYRGEMVGYSEVPKKSGTFLSKKDAENLLPRIINSLQTRIARPSGPTKQTKSGIFKDYGFGKPENKKYAQKMLREYQKLAQTVRIVKLSVKEV